MKNFAKRTLPLILVLVLCAAMTIIAGCGVKRSEGAYSTRIYKSGTIGKGATEFNLQIIDASNNEVDLKVKTDKKTVGEALLENEVIAGDNSEYGLYVKCVNGTVADYDVDQTYWAFYIEGEYAMTGVDSTDITPGATYALKVEK
ncbi:MAG: DUF4430 domain-containing protein [Lachnospiraceae bacterium]|nr:DUF4430 domain-containing protein [Lachnospiraceae bacterium]